MVDTTVVVWPPPSSTAKMPEVQIGSSQMTHPAHLFYVLAHIRNVELQCQDFLVDIVIVGIDASLNWVEHFNLPHTRTSFLRGGPDAT